MEDSRSIQFTRREFLITGVSSAVAITLPPLLTAQPSARQVPVLSKVSFAVNSEICELDLDARITLLDERDHGSVRTSR
jgi:hypothetical protein